MRRRDRKKAFRIQRGDVADDTATEDEGGEDGLVETFKQVYRQGAKDKETEIQGALKEAGFGSTDRSRVADDKPEKKPAMEAGRAKPGWEFRYPRELGEFAEERSAWRNPENDHQVRRWIQAMKGKDATTIREVEAWDMANRAELLEGTIAASGLGDGTGANLIPLPLELDIIHLSNRLGRMRSIARVRTSGAAGTRRFIIQTVAGAAAWVAESGAVTEVTPAYAGKVVALKKLGTVHIVSNEVLEDTPISVVSELSGVAGRDFAEAEDTAFCTGGTNAPGGWEDANTATDSVAEGTATELARADLVSLYFALPEMRRRTAVWCGNDRVAEILSSVTDGNLRGALDQSTAALRVVQDIPGAIGTVLGRPFVNLPFTSSATTTADTNRLYFADVPNTYGILDGVGIRTLVSADAGFADDTTHIRFIKRVGGEVLESAADQAVDEKYVFFDNLQSGVAT